MLEIAYIGSTFEGWQTQTSGNSVQQSIERALAIVQRSPTPIIGASRTDAGVHAKGQIAIFDSHDEPQSAPKIMLGLNALLPSDIKIMNMRAVADDFHPIKQSLGKVYSYRVWLGRFSSPFIAPYVWCTSFNLDLKLMANAANEFSGTHDFVAFCAADSSAKTTVRTINYVKSTVEGKLFTIEIDGVGFLKQMCRSIVGTLIDIGRGKLEPNSVTRILQSKDHSLAGQTAPALGLCLESVVYREGELIQRSGASHMMEI